VRRLLSVVSYSEANDGMSSSLLLLPQSLGSARRQDGTIGRHVNPTSLAGGRIVARANGVQENLDGAAHSDVPTSGLASATEAGSCCFIAAPASSRCKVERRGRAPLRGEVSCGGPKTPPRLRVARHAHSWNSSSSSGDSPRSTTTVWSSNEHHSLSLLSDRSRGHSAGSVYHPFSS